MVNSVTVYSTTWCGHCRRLKRQLDDAGIAYRAVELDLEPEADVDRRIRAASGGHRTVPSVEVGARLLVNPSVAEIEASLAAGGPPALP